MKNNETNHFFNFINKALLLVVQQLSVIGLITCVVTLFVANYVVVDRNGYESTYKVSPFASSRDFEDTEIFRDYCNDLQKEVLRLAVIREQLETDGVYDGKKIINIEEYVNRKQNGSVHQDITLAEEPAEAFIEYYDAGNGQIIEESVSVELEDTKSMNKAATADEKTEVCFYLEDLIKWGIYGFDYEEVEFTNVEENYFLVSNEIENDAIEQYVLLSESGNVDSFTETMLDCRYMTIEGQPLMAYAESIEEYFYWESLLIEAVESIYYNYQEYENLSPRWSEANSNAIYYITFQKGRTTYFYTNVLQYQNGYLDNLLVEDVKKTGHYIYFSPAELAYETNTSITQKELLSTIQNYDYFYPENVKIAIGIDTNNYAKEDVLKQAKDEYKSIVNNGTWYAVLALASMIVFIVTITLYTMRCLGEKDEDEYKISFWDKLPVELLFLLIFVLIWIWSIVMALFFPWIEKLGVIEYGKLFFTVYTGTTVWGYMNLLIVLYYGIIKRMSVGILWTNSIVCHIVRGFIFAYRNINSLLRTILGYGGFVLFNFVFILMAYKIHFSIILIPIIVDSIVFVFMVKADAERTMIKRQINKIREGDFEEKIDTEKMNYQNAILAEGVNNIGEGIRNAVDKSLKDERLKTDLITNVSHDIKTPLTSIINYVDLLKREDLQNEKAKGYVEILEAKSQRLKQLTDDLVEASKISSGNIVYQYEKINLAELLHQAEGEFSDRFILKNLHIVLSLRAENTYVWADSRRIWRVIENLLSNINKYAMSGTRVYIDMENFMEEEEEYVSLSMKNISEQPLNIRAEELTERFIRGDVARSTEGSGLGLSIAQNLTTAQGGKFDIHLDGDLFKVVLTFKTYIEE